MKKFLLALAVLAALLAVVPSEAADTVLETVGVTRVQQSLDELESRCQPVSADEETVEYLQQ
jgi:ABC-type transporter MlaC component